jgi:hypothetical protein
VLGARLLFATLFSGGVQLVIALVCRWRAPSYDEGFMLRWLRIVAEHPWRSGLALILLVVALRPPALEAQSQGRDAPW